MQEIFWIASLSVRALAVLIGGWRGAARFWCAWVIFYLLSGIALRVIAGDGPAVWYPPVWIAQQIISTLALILVVREAVSPTTILVVPSALAAVIVGAITSQAHHWTHSPIESVMNACGTASLALGIIAAVGSGQRRTVHSAILAVFLLGYAMLSLAGADYLKAPNIGIAWSLLECVCFGAWIFARK